MQEVVRIRDLLFACVAQRATHVPNQKPKIGGAQNHTEVISLIHLSYHILVASSSASHSAQHLVFSCDTRPSQLAFSNKKFDCIQDSSEK